MKTEFFYRYRWPTRQAVKTAIFEYIEGYYNTKRRHSAFGYLSPEEFEQATLQRDDVA